MKVLFRIVVIFCILSLILSSCKGKPDPPVIGCGPRSLAKILELMGRDVDVRELARLAGADGKGWTSMYGLAQAAKAYGLEAVGYRLSLEELKDIHLPAIAHVKGDHFVVLLSCGSSYVRIIDNDRQLDMSISDFARMWDGTVLVVREL